jgi:hypothetical protein
MIGLKYPEILYDKLKQDIANGLIPSSLIDFLTQLQIKLIYLEKEINVTKLNTFYTSRTIYLKKKNIDYNDSDIRVFHTIMSWLVIHKSTQLKGIASDKYLGCKYAKMKIGKNLCEQRIGIFDNVEEIDFNKLKKIGNVILKISNGCNDSVLITNTTKESTEQIKEKITYYYNRDFSLIVPDFFHSYSKKRIVLEKLFSPIEDLFEFKFMVFNNKIKMIILHYYIKNILFSSYYDEDYNFIEVPRKKKYKKYNINKFKTEDLTELKKLALKLSEDFPNFIRVDLYIFHNKIYLSELTFDSHSGKPNFLNVNYFNDGLKNWKRVDY